MRINLHWGISNLVSFTIIVTMLEIKQFAMAVEKPFPCWTCCRGKNRAPPPALRLSMQDEFSNTCYGRGHASAWRKANVGSIESSGCCNHYLGGRRRYGHFVQRY